ncbi:hypothetical protein [Streptomyces panacea]|uniref:hypothetical protein n=1 Tax=Streptomyces panacea TaxID=3035064 RepID=UPI00339C9D01
MPARTLDVATSLPPHWAGLTSGLGPALRMVALLVPTTMAAVAAGCGGTTLTRTIASFRKRVLSRSVSR